MWRIGIPAWGERCVPLAVNVGIPSIIAALQETRQDAHFTIHTDQADAFADCFVGHSRECRYVRPESDFTTFVACHREVMGDARPGEFVALLDGDHLVSRELFDACERRFATGKRLIMANGVRTVAGAAVPPSGSSAIDVSEFIFRNLHQISIELMWPTVTGNWPSMLFFRDSENLIAHCFHLHPVAFVAKPGLKVDVSVDGDLVNGFSHDETHVVIDPTELAIAEISPADRTISLGGRTQTVESIADWAANPRCASPTHRWFFRHTIVHRGSADAFDLSPVNEILDRLNEPTLEE